MEGGTGTADSRQQRYEEICTAIRTTDDISFKLLGFVPLVSGAGIFAVLDLLGSGGVASWPTTVFVALFGATVTFALFRWELRNIETCKWLRAQAERLEQTEFRLTSGPFLGRGDAPTVLGRRMGKTEAEKILYTATILAWLSLPAVSALIRYL